MLLEIEHYKKAVMTSMLPGQQCVGNCAYLLTSRDVILTRNFALRYNKIFCQIKAEG